MNKRLLALVVAIALLLCGCCTCDTQVEQLQQRVTEQENQLAAITVTEPSEPAPSEPAMTEPASIESAPTEPAPTEPASIESAPTEPAPTEPASDETNNISNVLDTLLNSDNPYDWKRVAECKEATSDHLLRCAKKCAGITYDKHLAYDIAERLVRHKNATDKVVEELFNSEHYIVWELGASADCNDTKSLIAVATKCASITETQEYANSIAERLLGHKNATGEVVKVLCNSEHYSVLELCASANCNDATSLIAVATKCASITETQEYADSIAYKLINHSKFTAQVAMELSNSKYSSVQNLALQALKSLNNG